MSTKTKKDHEAQLPELSPRVKKRIEEEQVQERVAIGAHVVHETIRREGDEELKRSASALAWSGFAAGLSMGFSLIAEGLLSAYLPKADWTPLISKLGYSVGFLIVVLGRQQLFTETTLTAVLPVLSKRNMASVTALLRLWGAVLLANLLGTYLFALCIERIPTFPPHIQQTFMEISLSGTGASFGVVFMRAIFAGWLIALMVWLLPAAESARVSIIIILTYLIGLGGYNHVIAGSVKAFFLVVGGTESWAQFFTGFFFPTLLGNIVGGVSLVAFLGHAQVVSGNDAGFE
jgi:formate/nitrite transporter FocA (FNT family)